MTFSLVQTAAAQNQGVSTSFNITFASTGAGNLLTAYIILEDYGANSTATATFPAGWVKRLRTVGVFNVVEIWDNINNPGGITTVAVTLNFAPATGGSTVTGGQEFSSGSPVVADQTGSIDIQNPAGSQAITTSGNLAANHELTVVAIGLFYDAAATKDTIGAGSGFTQAGQIGNGIKQQVHASFDHRLDSGGSSAGSTTNDTPTFTGGANTSFTGNIVTYLESPAVASGSSGWHPKWLGRARRWTAPALLQAPPSLAQPATFYPLNRPAEAVIRPLPQRGQVQSRPGKFQPTGPPFYPLRHPAEAVVRPLPPRGRTGSRTGPIVPAPFYPLRHPAGAVIRPLPVRGITSGRTGIFQQTGVPASPLHRPVQARLPLPPRGRTYSRAGVAGPPPPQATFYPLNHPSAAVVRPLSRRGQTQGRTGTFGQTGPPFVQLPKPHAAVVRPLPQRGTNASRPGLLGQIGPAFYALRHPAAAIIRPLAARGRAVWRTGLFQQTGVPFPPWHGPRAAVVRPFPPKGQVRSNQGTPQPTGSKFYPLNRPAIARLPLPLRGRTYSRTGTFSQTGVPFPARHGPVQARQPLPPRGQIRSNQGTPPVPPPPNQTVAYPLHLPVAAVIRPLPARGRATSRAGTFAQTGSPFYTLRHPVQARRPLPPKGTTQGRAGVLGPAPFYPLNHPASAVVRPLSSRGKTAGRSGTFGQTGPPVRSLLSPVSAVVRPLPVKGRAQGRAGIFGQTGPTVTPLQRPVATTIRPLPPRGRAQGRTGTFGQLGPPVTPLHRPVAARLPLPPRGTAQGRSAPPVQVINLTTAYPLQKPVASVVRPLPPKGRTAGRAGQRGQTGPTFYPLNKPSRARVPALQRRTGGTALTTPPHVSPALAQQQGLVFVGIGAERWTAGLGSRWDTHFGARWGVVLEPDLFDSRVGPKRWGAEL